MKTMLANPDHEVVYQDLLKLLRKHEGKVSSLEMLAIAANMVGKMVALQDQRKYTPADVMNMVASNIENGNKQVLDLLQTSGQLN